MESPKTVMVYVLAVGVDVEVTEVVDRPKT
jgi:hypothetical protein